MTMTRFELVFTEGPDPELLETRFYHPAIGAERRCRRGRIATNCFQWSAGVQAMTLLMLKSVDSKRKNQDRAVIQGGGGTPAATLDYAISKQPNWMLDMFGLTAGGTPAVARLFSRINPERKRPGPVEISLNNMFLPLEGINVLTGNKPASDSSLEEILHRLESQATEAIAAVSAAAPPNTADDIDENRTAAALNIDPLLAALSSDAAGRLEKNFAKAALDPAIKDALEAFCVFLERDPESAVQACLSDRYFVAEVPYTHLDGGFVNVQRKLRDLVADSSLGRPSTFGKPDYGSILEKIAERRLRVLYLFPFFLIPSRRRLFGVLPYARHRSIGLIIHRNHPAYGDLARLRSNAGNPLVRSAGEGKTAFRQSEARWVAEAVRATERSGGVITWTDGYVYYDLLSEMLQGADSEAANALHARQIATDVKEVPELYFNTSPSSHWHGEIAKPEHSLHLFDPGEAELLGPRLGSGWELIVSDHHLDIPAGIGFTLPMLPSLLIDGAWERLLAEAKLLYGAYASELRLLGMDFSER